MANQRTSKDFAGSWQALKDAGLTYKEIAGRDDLNPLAKTPEAIKQACKRYRKEQREDVRSLGDLVAPLLGQTYETPIVETDNAIITSDWEIPDMDSFMIRLSLALGQHHNIRHKIIAGDLVAGDEDGLTSHPKVWQPETPRPSYQTNIRATKTMLRKMSNWYTKGVWILEGNHDDRPARATNGEIHLGMFLEDLEGVDYNRYLDLWVKTSKGYVYVVHPRQYRANSLSLAEAIWKPTIAPDGTKPVAIVVGHTHQAKTGYSPDGKCRFFALGCVRDLKRTQYIHISGRAYPKWVNSILMIRNGHFYPIDRDADLDFWVGHLAKSVRGK